MADCLEDVAFIENASPNSTVGAGAHGLVRYAAEIHGPPYYARYGELTALGNDVKPFDSYVSQLIRQVFNREDLSDTREPRMSLG